MNRRRKLERRVDGDVVIEGVLTKVDKLPHVNKFLKVNKSLYPNKEIRFRWFFHT